MKQKQEKLETKMKWMLLSTMIPMTILIIVLLVFFWHYTNEYNQLSNNLAVSSEYNANYRNSNNDMSFKDEVDMDIYYVTIGRKGKDGLPTEQVDKAISTVESLKKTTSKKESLRSLKYLTNYLENLKKRMNQLLEIKNYQERRNLWQINTEILTTLFEERNADIFTGGDGTGADRLSAGWKCTSDDHHYVCGDFGCYGYSAAAFFPSDIQHYQTDF